MLLENVRNLTGPRHDHEWEVIIRTLREEGYHVSTRPAIFSPHLLPAHLGGTPQVRERVFITATHAPETVPRHPDGSVNLEAVGPPPVASMADRFPATSGSKTVFEPGHQELGWSLIDGDLLDDTHNIPGCELSAQERLWIDAWDEFVQFMRERSGEPLKGFPYWADSWTD